MFDTITTKLEAIRNLPICELDKRMPMLVDLAATIVNFETEDGAATDSAYGLERQDYWGSLRLLMRDAGFTLLGNGHFSAAYAHDMLPGKVIKVGFKKEDSGAAYVAFCRMHQGRDGIPNVYHVERHAGCYTVVLDKLLPYDRGNDDHSWFADTAREAIEIEGVDIGDYDDDEKPFVQTCLDIRKFFKGIASFDMHGGNIMFTESGDAVITDPVSFSHDRDRESFPLEPEALLAEVEQIAHDKMIERCRLNKAKRDRESTHNIARRLNNKRKRQRAKSRRRRMKQFEAMEQAANNSEIKWRVDAWHKANGIAIAFGQPLVIDNYLQARLMG